jgi:hypothetical protein
MRAAARPKELSAEAKLSSNYLPVEAFLTPLIGLYGSTKPMSVQGSGTKMGSLKELIETSVTHIV